MEYKYKFTNGEEITIELDEEVYALLQEADRVDYNNAHKYRRHTASLESFGFEPEFMAVEEDAFKDDPTAPAYEYAMRHLQPKHQDLLTRRLVNGEQFSKIAASYQSSDSATHRAYKKAKERFSHFYNDGVWLFSKENLSLPEADRVHFIPFGLTPEQVQQIQKLRQEHKTIDAIAQLLKVPRNRVKVCLRHNPITKTKCLNCGATIKQIGAGKLQNFCCKACYYNWFHKEGMVHNTCPTIKKKKVYMSLPQQIATDFYRQRYLSQKEISKILGVSDDYISAYCLAHPLPYILCRQCGKQMPGVHGEKSMKYCSEACCTAYWNQSRNKKKRAPQVAMPAVEQLYRAIELRDAYKSYKRIQKETGLTDDDLDTLFRFHPKIDKRRKI